MSELQATIHSVPGFQAAGVPCGLKPDNSLDFALFVSEKPCTAAGVFTTNQIKSATVICNQNKLKTHSESIRAVAINSKNANACTGEQGVKNALKTGHYIASKIGCDPNEVLVMSTGVIGEQLPMDAIRRGVDLAWCDLGDHWEAAARAIMTTDTRPKLASICGTTQTGTPFTVAGVAKGAGMIAPNMATLLSVIVTDANFSQAQVSQALKEVADHSYNQIVIDGDMSTNDTVLLLSNGLVELKTITDYQALKAALEQVCVALSQAIVRDGEGATKFVTIQVDGAPDDASAKMIAHTIANSPLVKTAFYGNDANWGRILMAAGKSGVPMQLEKTSLHLNAGVGRNGSAVLLLENGTPISNEETASTIMREDEFTFTINFDNGNSQATVWTCDLSHEYISINADYRT